MIVPDHPSLQGEVDGRRSDGGVSLLDRATPLHHFVVPLPLQGRNLRALLVDFARSAFSPKTGRAAVETIDAKASWRITIKAEERKLVKEQIGC